MNYCEDNRYLLLAIDIEADLFAEKDPIEIALTEMVHVIKMHTDHVGEDIKTKLAAINAESHEGFAKAINEVKDLLTEIKAAQ